MQCSFPVFELNIKLVSRMADGFWHRITGRRRDQNTVEPIPVAPDRTFPTSTLHRLPHIIQSTLCWKGEQRMCASLRCLLCTEQAAPANSSKQVKPLLQEKQSLPAPKVMRGYHEANFQEEEKILIGALQGAGQSSFPALLSAEVQQTSLSKEYIFKPDHWHIFSLLD